MKILYGVQGTGNGHISRANAMAEAFAAYPDIEITWLLSGRDQELGCGEIKDFLWRRGLTFSIQNGQLKIFRTLAQNNIFKFLRDVNQLDLSPYDLLIADYEPVLCHAARKRGIPVLGIGHQYAFNYSIPKSGDNFIVRAIMRHFAPVTQGIGLHWHHFNQPILPPIVDLEIPASKPETIANKVLVYLPFESSQEMIQNMSTLSDYEFYFYHPELSNSDLGNIHSRAFSRHGFRQDLFSADRIICNSGFELISECLQIGKKILTKPLHGQMEQHSNAKALDELGYATVTNTLNIAALKQWLNNCVQASQVIYPEVAPALAHWIATGRKSSLAELSSQLWQDEKKEPEIPSPDSSYNAEQTLLH